MWSVHVKFSFIVRPRKLNCLTLSMLMLSIFICKGSICFWAVWNSIYLVFVILIESLFVFSQSLIFINSSFITVFISLLSVFLKIVLSVLESVVPSAYIIKSNMLLACAISFIYIINKRGQSIKP